MDALQPKVFISHTSEDSNLVNNLFVNLERAFPDVVFFISLKYRSIIPGDVWLSDIINALNTSNIVLVCLTRTSINKPWIWFEAGGGYCNGKAVIPLVLDDLPFDAIKPPLQSVQAIRIDKKGIIEIIHYFECVFKIRASDKWYKKPFLINKGIKNRPLKKPGIYLKNKKLDLMTGWERYSGDPLTLLDEDEYISIGSNFDDGFRYPPTDSLSVKCKSLAFRIKPLSHVWFYAVIKLINGEEEKIVVTTGNSSWGYVTCPNNEFVVPLPPISMNTWSTIIIDLSSFEHRLKSPIEKVIGFRVRGPIHLSHIWCLENNDIPKILRDPDFKIVYPS